MADLEYLFVMSRIYYVLVVVFYSCFIYFVGLYSGNGWIRVGGAGSGVRE